MIERGNRAAARLGIGKTFDEARFGREVMADAMPMLEIIATALNYAHFKLLGTEGDLPGGLGFSYGPAAITIAKSDIGAAVMPDYYDRIFMFSHDKNGCWISMQSHTPISKCMETEFQATVGLNGQFVVTTRNRHGDIVNQSDSSNPQDIVDLCTEWVARNFSEAQRRLVATHIERLCNDMVSDRTFTRKWVNRFAHS